VGQCKGGFVSDNFTNKLFPPRLISRQTLFREIPHWDRDASRAIEPPAGAVADGVATTGDWSREMDPGRKSALLAPAHCHSPRKPMSR